MFRMLMDIGNNFSYYSICCMKNILIAIQAVHKKDVLKRMTSEALASIKTRHRWNVQVDDRDVSLAEKWNSAFDVGIKWGVDYVILANNDILFDEKCLDNLVEFADIHPEYLVTGPTQYFQGEKSFYNAGIDETKLHWSFVMMNPIKFVDAIGYCETRLKRGTFVDTELQIRIDKLGYKVARTMNSWFFHYNDTTHRLLPDYRDSFARNEGILIEKWGHGYTFDKPYNDSNLPMRFIGEYGAKKKQRAAK